MLYLVDPTGEGRINRDKSGGNGMGRHLGAFTFGTYAGQPAASGDLSVTCFDSVCYSFHSSEHLGMLFMLPRSLQQCHTQNLHSRGRFWWSIHSCEAGESNVAPLQTTTGAQAKAGQPTVTIDKAPFKHANVVLLISTMLGFPAWPYQ